ncbi:sulfite exporter TauE/SafE family protein [Spirosoma sp. KCTC 42546]|uniref:sulfite exporter TauE/SafE family protein n=1 Tax=Spirosoma sp. KCTC 42546 TaxID=2520506 RepID=UPI00115886E2|nr:sulfite exporter TauE/SafE family protein [Spirosoma sp. KCTC 42546]QDK82171.1 sulfite exporter TauE/SafE family protein [Spirosoma sp. KCTC 42546]
MSPWLTTAFLTGLISSLHCVGMCGPLVAALPVGRLPQGQRWKAVGLYHTGRIATYGTLGALAGTMSLGLNLMGWQRPLAVICGVVLLVSFLWRKGLPGRLRWPWLNAQITTLFRHHLYQPNWADFAGLGILNGLLPCGFTYLALAGTLATNTPLAGASYMLLFGAGTLPALLGVNLVAGWITIVGRQRLNQVLSVATVVVALLLIGRGLADYQLPIGPADIIPICHGLLTGK